MELTIKKHDEAQRPRHIMLYEICGSHYASISTAVPLSADA